LPLVYNDHSAIGQMAAEHLLGCNLKHFAYIGIDVAWSDFVAKAVSQPSGAHDS
jgi:DNA-binding LacI/PurR family transcriptional regulator